MARVPIAIALGLLIGMGSVAEAAGPKPVGGDGREIIYKQNLGGGRYFELRALPNGQVTWLEVDTKWNCADRRYTRVKPFLADGKPRIDSSRRIRATDSYDKGHWKLRFSADWSKVSGSFSARNAGCRTAALRVSGKRVRPAHPYALGHYAGTTSQGLPISFDATYVVRYGMIEYLITRAHVGVHFVCADGTTADKALSSDMDGTVSTPNSTFWASVNESGKPSSSLDELSADLDGKLSGSTAGGVLQIGGFTTSSGVSCDVPAPGASFSIQRS